MTETGPISNPPPSMIEWLRIWFAVLTRPTQAAYADLFDYLPVSRATALAWLVTGGVVAALITMITYGGPVQVMLIATVCAMPLFSMIYVALTVITTRSALWFSAQMGGEGSLDRLLIALAAINAPMAILSSLAYLLPYGSWIAYALALYWIYLTVLAVKVLCGLKWGQALLAASVFIVLSLLVAAMSVGISFLPAPGA